MELPWIVGTFRILNDPVPVDNKRRTLRHASHRQVTVRRKAVISNSVRLRHSVIVVAQERDADLLFLCPHFQRKRAITADPVNLSVYVLVVVERSAGLTQFGRTSSGERFALPRGGLARCGDRCKSQNAP